MRSAKVRPVNAVKARTDKTSRDDTWFRSQGPICKGGMWSCKTRQRRQGKMVIGLEA